MHIQNIKDKHTIITSSQDGKIGFISADDIADLAFDALTRAESYNTDKILVGPELLSYNDVCFPRLFLALLLMPCFLQVAKTFSEVLGITITHTRVSTDELQKMYIGRGVSEDRAALVCHLETLNAKGVEEQIFVHAKKVAGRRTLKSFVEANKDAWKA